jgi:hypothetical protein
VDAGADPNYQFNDLKNLVIRARNELGIEIDFKENPEEIILPKSSRGYSQNHFILADLKELPKREKTASESFGQLIYVKASMTAPGSRIEKSGNCKSSKKQSEKINSRARSESISYFYKTYHAKFPHESTADQFFDTAQWEAYRYLGRNIAIELLRQMNFDWAEMKVSKKQKKIGHDQ